MIEGEGEDGVCKRGFSLYGGPHVCGGSVYGYVKIVQGVVFPVSAVNCSLWCRELKSSRIFCMLVWLESNISISAVVHNPVFVCQAC
jgi:hypothetical protein